jgi:hypothetical protein
MPKAALTPAQKATRQSYRKANKPAFAVRQRKHRALNPDKARDSVRRSMYGLKPGQYEQMLWEQDGLCAICRQAPRDAMNVDHDHACCPERKKACGNCVRGLLCRNCNSLLGYAKESVDVLLSAIRYLVKHATR